MPNHIDLEHIAAKLRYYLLKMNNYAGSGHPGGSLSAAEIVAYLFHNELNFSKENYLSPSRDRFILSKGHACLVLYAALAELNIIPENSLKTLRHINGMLQGHPDRIKTPGIEFNSGSLGQGFSFSLGCALGGKRSKNNFRVYCLLGDGELNEGQIWEGMMFGAHYRLDNLCAIVDYNKLQSDDYNTNITSLEPLMDKFKSFGWHTIEIDGHDFRQISNAFNRAKRRKNIPTIILAHTTKGKGVSFMENEPKWHGSIAPNAEELQVALQECCNGVVD